MEHPDRSGAELAAQAVAYAQRLETAPSEDDDTAHPRAHTIVSAALIVARDATDTLLDEQEAWLRSVFTAAIAGESDVGASTFRNGIRFNPVAIAILGLIHLWGRGRGDAQIGPTRVGGTGRRVRRSRGSGPDFRLYAS